MRMKEPTITKKALLKSVKDMPDTVVVEDIIERILLLSKIENGVAEAKAGKGSPIEAVEKRVRSWSK